MLKTNKPIYKVILIINLVCAVAGVVLCTIQIARYDGDMPRMLSALFNIVALLAALYYIFGGYTKDSAQFYKVAGFFLALSQIASIAYAGTAGEAYYRLILGALILSVTVTLLCSSNLGKKKSLTLCASQIALSLLLVAGSIADSSFLAVYDNLFVRLILLCLYGIMTYAKYLDKAERGTN